MNVLRTAEILAVGSELLTPFRVDTNSLYLTAQLNELGIDVRNKGVVGDEPADIRARVLTALERADIVITSGGLGPTGDDLTRETVAAALGLTLAEDAVDTFHDSQTLRTQRLTDARRQPAPGRCSCRRRGAAESRTGPHPGCGSSRVRKSWSCCPVRRVSCSTSSKPT